MIDEDMLEEMLKTGDLVRINKDTISETSDEFKKGFRSGVISVKKIYDDNFKELKDKLSYIERMEK